jgi:hypothetical protein
LLSIEQRKDLKVELQGDVQQEESLLLSGAAYAPSLLPLPQLREEVQKINMSTIDDKIFRTHVQHLCNKNNIDLLTDEQVETLVARFGFDIVSRCVGGDQYKRFFNRINDEVMRVQSLSDARVKDEINKFGFEHRGYLLSEKQLQNYLNSLNMNKAVFDIINKLDISFNKRQSRFALLLPEKVTDLIEMIGFGPVNFLMTAEQESHYLKQLDMSKVDIMLFRLIFKERDLLTCKERFKKLSPEQTVAAIANTNIGFGPVNYLITPEQESHYLKQLDMSKVDIMLFKLIFKERDLSTCKERFKKLSPEQAEAAYKKFGKTMVGSPLSNTQKNLFL